MTLLFSSCVSFREPLNKDIQKLQAIYEQSNWDFRPSSLNIQVYEKGTIRLSIQGEATERSPNGDQFAWIPVALFEELPEYYAIEADKSIIADLTAYQVEGGLWSIVALVRGTEQKGSQTNKNSTGQTESNSTASSDKLTQQINFDVLMISPGFAKSLPLYLPVGQGMASVKTSIELPEKAKFISHLIKSNGKLEKLIEFPLSLSDGRVKALTNLDPNLTILWDLSNIQYQFPIPIFPKLLKFLSILLLIFGIFELFYLRKKRIRELRIKRRKLEKERQYLLMEKTNKTRVERNKKQKKIDENRKKIDEINRELRSITMGFTNFREFRKKFFSITLDSKIRFISYGIIILIFILFFLSSVAFSQDNEETININESYDFCFERLSSQTLCLEKFKLTIAPPKIEKDVTNVELEFIPINADRDKEIFIRFDKQGNQPNYIKICEEDICSQICEEDICQISTRPDNLDVKKNQNSISRIKNMPSNLLPDSLKDLGSSANKLSEVVGGITPLQSYVDFIDSPRRESVTVTYPLQKVLGAGRDAQIKQLDIGPISIKDYHKTLVLFPFDEKRLEIPVTVEDAQAALSSFVFEDPKKYNDAQVKLLINQKEFDLEEIANDKNKLKTPPYQPILSKKPFVIKATLSPPDHYARAIVSWLIPAAIVIGTGLGLFVSSKTSLEDKAKALVPLLIVVFGWFSCFWLYITNLNQDIPFVFEKGFFLVIFNLFVASSFVLLVLTAIIGCFATSPVEKVVIGVTGSLLALLVFIREFYNFPLVENFIGIIAFVIPVILVVVTLISFFTSYSFPFNTQQTIMIVLSNVLLVLLIPIYGFCNFSRLENLAYSQPESLSTFFDWIKITLYYYGS